MAILKGMNAQGMVTWDIEGEQYPQSTTYIGDPRIFMNLAPEMVGVADIYFKKFSDAGLRVGLCIRPQQLVVSADGSSASQQELADPTQLMIDKMTYAYQRWGATLFYVDSNGDPNLPYDFNFFRRVQQALPNVLVMPEHKNTGYYGVTAPYAELRQGFASTPSAVRDVYPGAFSLINTADGPINARYADLQAAVAGGDIMMFRGWFDDGNNATIKSLYNGQTTTPPVTSIVAPTAGSTVQGNVAVIAQASGANGIAGVKLLIDNVQFGSEITSGNYSWTWNSTSVSNGAHILTVVARDSQGQTGSGSETVQVSNVVAAPVVSITSPTANSTVSGTVSLAASASSSIGIASVQFSVDGTAVGTATSSPYSATWDSTKATNGTHTITALAKDTAGTTSSATVSFMVNNVVAAPLVSVTSPTANSTVSGTVSLAASASSSIGIASVQFSVDGTAVGTATSAPYSATWDSTKATNGTHTITALAKDTAGTTSSATVSFTVNNVAAAPAVSITSPVCELDRERNGVDHRIGIEQHRNRQCSILSRWNGSRNRNLRTLFRDVGFNQSHQRHAHHHGPRERYRGCLLYNQHHHQREQRGRSADDLHHVACLRRHHLRWHLDHSVGIQQHRHYTSAVLCKRGNARCTHRSTLLRELGYQKHWRRSLQHHRGGKRQRRLHHCDKHHLHGEQLGFGTDRILHLAHHWRNRKRTGNTFRLGQQCRRNR